MDRFCVGDLGSADYAWDVQITAGAFGRADADGLVGEADVQAVTIGLGVYGDGLDAEIFGCTYDAQCNLATIGNQNLLEHDVLVGPNRKESFAVFYRLAVFYQPGYDRARNFGFNLVHELHGLDDADRCFRSY